MEAVHRHGVWLAESLQRGPLGLGLGGGPGYERLWQTLTHMGDPKASMLLLFPLAHTLHGRTGVAVLWVAALSEWLNLVLKWMLFGERPFWWISESGLYLQNPPEVQQFASTCETGPGSPSGHAMVTAAVWWVVVFNTASYLYRRTHSLLLSSLPYLLYVVMLVAVGLSRVFILAHFPHQVLAGSVTGFILGVVLSRRVPHGRPLLFFVCTSMALLAGALSLHAGLSAAGVDLSWSISLARKHCSRPEWVRMDTAPFSSLTRDCGALLGLGLARHWAPPGGWALSRAPRALSLALASLALYHLNRLALPVRPPGLFYGLFLVKFIMVPQVVMVLAPGLVHMLTHRAGRKRD